MRRGEGRGGGWGGGERRGGEEEWERGGGGNCGRTDFFTAAISPPYSGV